MKFPFLKNRGQAGAKIEVFVRYCYYSNASAHKGRFEGFSHEKCFENLMQTTDFDRVGCTFLLDTHFAKSKPHFVQKQTRFPVIEIDAGEEGKSFLALLDHVMERQFSDDTILYFLEDDYLHKEGWVDVLLEGFSIREADYVTLFDHRDKYFHEMYRDLKSRLFHTETCHWRTTPSTTNTYAMRVKTLRQDIDIHRKFSKDQKITLDHEKFLALKEQGRTLISSIPGWATHAEPDFASPCFDWTRILSQESLQLR